MESSTTSSGIWNLPLWFLSSPLSYGPDIRSHSLAMFWISSREERMWFLLSNMWIHWTQKLLVREKASKVGEDSVKQLRIGSGWTEAFWWNLVKKVATNTSAISVMWQFFSLFSGLLVALSYFQSTCILAKYILWPRFQQQQCQILSLLNTTASSGCTQFSL